MTAAVHDPEAPPLPVHPDELRLRGERDQLRKGEATCAELAPLSEPDAWALAFKEAAERGDRFANPATGRVPLARKVLAESKDPLARRGAVVLLTMGWVREWQPAYRDQVQTHVLRALADLRHALAGAEEFARNVAADEALAGQALEIAKPAAQDLDRLRSIVASGIRWGVPAEPTPEPKLTPARKGIRGLFT
jgi:hypothetical protein